MFTLYQAGSLGVADDGGTDFQGQCERLSGFLSFDARRDAGVYGAKEVFELEAQRFDAIETEEQEMAESFEKKNEGSGKDVEANVNVVVFDNAVDSAATQIIGVAILEFGVLLHRCVMSILFYSCVLTNTHRVSQCAHRSHARRDERLQDTLYRHHLPS